MCDSHDRRQAEQDGGTVANSADLAAAATDGTTATVHQPCPTTRLQLLLHRRHGTRRLLLHSYCIPGMSVDFIFLHSHIPFAIFKYIVISNQHAKVGPMFKLIKYWTQSVSYRLKTDTCFNGTAWPY